VVVENVRESGSFYSAVFFKTAHTLRASYNRWAGPARLPVAVYSPRKVDVSECSYTSTTLRVFLFQQMSS
jgi:hypothetical protein